MWFIFEIVGYTILAKGTPICSKTKDFCLREHSQLHGLQKH